MTAKPNPLGAIQDVILAADLPVEKEQLALGILHGALAALFSGQSMQAVIDNLDASMCCAHDIQTQLGEARRPGMF
jgi:hypothetical protein